MANLAALAEFHSLVLQSMSASAGVHINAIRNSVMSIKHTDHPLSKSLVNRLTQLDLAYKVLRHVTGEHIKSVLVVLDSELAPLAAGGSSPLAASSPLVSSVSDVDLRQALRDLAEENATTATQITKDAICKFASTFSQQMVGVVTTQIDEMLAPVYDPFKTQRTQMDVELKQHSEDLKELHALLAPLLAAPPVPAAAARVSPPPAPAAAPRRCRFFAQDRCHNGDQCRFLHDDILTDIAAREDAGLLGDRFSPVSQPHPVPQSDSPLTVCATVFVHGHVAAKEYNGKIGLIVARDSSSGRFHVKFGDAKCGAFKPDNLRFPAACPRCGGEVTSNRCFVCNS